ncbi:PQQ-binding-like beta-propeller repeat protein [Flaviaesturariibacter amylovorans]|uniref:Pyrrolo-quinoline quinone repeat domain-containing protein n=1 Tax=Flaviaesturariibacter amylovorans TaxID=1084520 RepID=A0ABP8H1K7_9BACT
MNLLKLAAPRWRAGSGRLVALTLLLAACSRSGDIDRPAGTPPTEVAGFIEVHAPLDAAGNPAYNSTLVAYSRNGVVRWQRPNLYAVVPFPHRSAHGLMFTVSSSASEVAQLQALDLSNGSVRWTTPPGRRVATDCVFSDSLLYVAASTPDYDSSWVQAYQWRTGTLQWERYVPGVLYNFAIDSSARRLYFSSISAGTGFGFRVHAFDLQAKQDVWAKSFGLIHNSNGPFVLNGDLLHFIDAASGLHTVSTATGNELWSLGNAEAGDPYLIGDKLFVRSFRSSENRVLSLNARTGTINWWKGTLDPFTSPHPYYYTDLLMPPGGSDLYVASYGDFRQDTLHQLDPATGDLRQRFPVIKSYYRLVDDVSLYTIRDGYADPSAGNRSKVIVYDLATRLPKDSFFLTGSNGISFAPYW